MEANLKKKQSRLQGSPNRGFSLIELLVVVAVILILVAIAIPNFIQSKMRANEAASVQNLRTITTAQVAYATTYGGGFSPDIPSLGGTGTVVDKNHAQLIDEVLASSTKAGYRFSYAVLTQDAAGNVTSYSINADPVVQGSTGIRHFYVDQTAVIRGNDSATAGSTDSPLQ